MGGSAVVVGIDGSRTAVDAALWAVDEAVCCDVPLRLLYAIDPASAYDPQSAARDLATAELAVRCAFTAVESTERPIKIEVEILQAKPVDALLEASRSAAMVCVGALGLTHDLPGGIGSTAAGLVHAAHCPVAIIRSVRSVTERGWILVEVDNTVDSDTTLECGLAEARVRGAPLNVVQVWPSRFSDVCDPGAAASNNRAMRAQLQRRLARWRRLSPDTAIQAVAVHGTMLGYLAKHARSIELVVVAAHRTGGPEEFVGPVGMAALRDSGCSVLVCDGL